MKALLPLIAILSACAGGAEMKPDGSVKVYGPVAARVDRLAVNAKTPLGTMKFLMVNGNAESVPNNIVNVFGSGLALKAGVKINENNNDQKNFHDAASVAGQKPTVLTNTATDGVNTSTTQTAIPFVAPNRIPKK